MATEAAARRGLELEIGSEEGGPTEGIIFHQVRLRGRGTDLRVRRIEVSFSAPAIPYFQRPKGSLFKRLVVEGLEGEAVLTPPPSVEAKGTPDLPWQNRLREQLTGWFGSISMTSDFVPAGWSLRNLPNEAFTLVAPAAGGLVRSRGLRLSTGDQGNPGFFSIEELEARGPGGLAHRSATLHGSVGWHGTWLTVREVAVLPGLTLDGLTVEIVQLVRRGRLEGEVTLRALGGEIRAQGTAGPGPDGRPNLAVACSMTGVGVLPMAELLGVPTPVPLGGTVRAGQFSFRGDPLRPADGTGSLLVEMLDFRFGSRAWQRLRVAASVLPPRATVHELKLVQGANTVDLDGEFPVAALTDLGVAWREGPVRGRLNAHLGDLSSFGQLLGPAFPPLTGRLDLRGELRAAAGNGEVPDGDIQIKAGPLTVRGAPLDRLSAEVHLRHGEWEVRELQAVRGEDSLTGKGSFRTAGGPFRYAAEGRVQARDLAVYAGAFPPGMFPTAPRGSFAGEWSGDGSTGSHAGAFKGRGTGLLVPEGGPGALPRPVDVEAEGTYSPESVAFRRLILRDGANPKADFHLRLENVAIPWTQNAAALAAGHFFQPEGTLAGRLEARELALDLLAPLLPVRFGVGAGTDGRVTGWLDLSGTPRVPRFAGASQLRRARLRWRDRALRWAELDALAADLTVESGGDHLRIERSVGERPPAAGGGGLSFGGRVGWTERAAPLDLDLTAQGKNIGLLDSRTARVRGDVDLVVHGPSDAPEIAGDVRLREGGRYWRQFRFAATPPPLPAGTALSFPTLPDPPLANATWNVHVSAAGPLLLEGAAGLRGELRPDYRLTGTGRHPVLQGVFTLRRAKLALPAAEMDLEEGSFRFDGNASPGELILDVPARKAFATGRRGESVTRLHADFSGPAAEGRVSFSAEPPEWSPGEVAAFLVAGTVPPPVSAPPPPAGSEPGEPLPEPRLYLRLR